MMIGNAARTADVDALYYCKFPKKCYEKKEI